MQSGFCGRKTESSDLERLATLAKFLAKEKFESAEDCPSAYLLDRRDWDALQKRIELLLALRPFVLQRTELLRQVGGTSEHPVGGETEKTPSSSSSCVREEVREGMVVEVVDYAAMVDAYQCLGIASCRKRYLEDAYRCCAAGVAALEDYNWQLGEDCYRESCGATLSISLPGRAGVSGTLLWQKERRECGLWVAEVVRMVRYFQLLLEAEFSTPALRGETGEMVEVATGGEQGPYLARKITDAKLMGKKEKFFMKMSSSRSPP